MESRSYRNLLAWQRSRDLAIDVCRATAAEGNERGSDRDCARFFHIARGSLAELSTQAEIGRAVELLDGVTAERWILEADEIARMLAALIRRRQP